VLADRAVEKPRNLQPRAARLCGGVSPWTTVGRLRLICRRVAFRSAMKTGN
jgi:hypothetical protein